MLECSVSVDEIEFVKSFAQIDVGDITKGYESYEIALEENLSNNVRVNEKGQVLRPVPLRVNPETIKENKISKKIKSSPLLKNHEFTFWT